MPMSYPPRRLPPWAPWGLSAMLLTGCFTPPVVGAAHRGDWTLERSAYPRDARVVEVAQGPGEGPGPTLRGLWVPSDAGAPIVVHFAESGASVTSSVHARRQYHDLAELGFASLAIDYRGVGLSDGERSPRRLGEDALAIWSHALDLVEGDAGRLVLRGSSLGTVAASSLLERGLAPAACIAFAPVRPRTVARRYGLAVFWDPLVWLAAPFLRTFSTADPLRWLGQAGVPRLVVASPDDELLGPRDFERLRLGVESSGGRFVVPERLIVTVLNDDPVMRALGKHIALSHRSHSVGVDEEEFLRDAFPAVPDLEQRLERIRKLGAPGAVALVESDEEPLARLKLPLGRHRRLPPSLALAAAHRLTASELGAFDGWFIKPFNQGVRESFRGRPFVRLLTLLDLDDAGGRLPIGLIVAARQVLGRDLESGGAPRWSRQRVGALVSAFLGEAIPGRVFRERGDKLGDGESWRFGTARDGGLPYAERTLEGTRAGQLFLGDLGVHYGRDAEGRSGAEARRRLLRCFMKAAGLYDSPSSRASVVARPRSES